jgi:DNA transformation protein
MRNIGPKSRIWLAEIDIHTIDDLRALGAVEVYARLRFRFGRAVTRNMLHALAAAVDDIDWRHLPGDVKRDLDQAAAVRVSQFIDR